MNKIIYETTTKEEISLKESRCLFCDIITYSSNHKCKTQGFIEVYFGYGSKYDDDEYQSGICDRCFNKYLRKKMTQTKSLGNDLRKIKEELKCKKIK